MSFCNIFFKNYFDWYLIIPNIHCHLLCCGETVEETIWYLICYNLFWANCLKHLLLEVYILHFPSVLGALTSKICAYRVRNHINLKLIEQIGKIIVTSLYFLNVCPDDNDKIKIKSCSLHWELRSLVAHINFFCHCKTLLRWIFTEKLFFNLEK